MKHDWKKIKSEYVKGASRESICKDYKLNYGTLNKRIVRDKWNDERDKIMAKVSQKFEEKISESLADKQAKFVEKQFSFFNKVFDDEVTKYDSLKDSPDYKLVMNELKEIVKLARQAIGLTDAKTESTVTINKYKELSDEEIEKELIARGLPTNVFND